MDIGEEFLNRALLSRPTPALAEAVLHSRFGVTKVNLTEAGEGVETGGEAGGGVGGGDGVRRSSC